MADLTDKELSDLLYNTPAPQPSTDRSVGEHIQDAATSFAQGVAGIPRAAVGVGNLLTGGQTGRTLSNIGVDINAPVEALDQFHTDQHRTIQQGFQDAEGLGGKLAYAVKNPTMVTNTVFESLPYMGAGALVGRGAKALSPTLSNRGAMALGEGAVEAGNLAEKIRGDESNVGGMLTMNQTGLAALGGVATSLFTLGGAALSKKLGIGDVDELIYRGMNPSQVQGAVAGQITQLPPKSVPRKIIEGAFAEGLLEELPQEVTQQLLENLGTNKPWYENLDSAAVLGTLSGGLMGGLSAPFGGQSQQQQPQAPQAPQVPQAPQAPQGGMLQNAAATVDGVPPAPAPQQPFGLPPPADGAVSGTVLNPYENAEFNSRTPNLPAPEQQDVVIEHEAPEPLREELTREPPFYAPQPTDPNATVEGELLDPIENAHIEDGLGAPKLPATEQGSEPVTLDGEPTRRGIENKPLDEVEMWVDKNGVAHPIYDHNDKLRVGEFAVDSEGRVTRTPDVDLTPPAQPEPFREVPSGTIERSPRQQEMSVPQVPEQQEQVPEQQEQVPEQQEQRATPVINGNIGGRRAPKNTAIPATKTAYDRSLTQELERVRTARDYDDTSVYDVPLNKLKLSQAVPQFKRGADKETGTVDTSDSILDGRRFDPTKEPVTARMMENGELEIITGRHRFELAKRDPDVFAMPVRIVRERDGWDDRRARLHDVKSNAQDGKGTLVDFVSIYSDDATLTPDESAGDRSDDVKGHFVAHNGSEALISNLVNGALTPVGAVDITRAFQGDHASQNLATDLVVNKGHKINAAIAQAQVMKAYNGYSTPVMDDMFGGQVENDMMVAIGGEVIKRQKALRTTAAGIASFGKSKDNITKAGIVDDEDVRSNKIPEEHRAALEEVARWEKWYEHDDIRNEMLQWYADKNKSVLESHTEEDLKRRADAASAAEKQEKAEQARFDAAQRAEQEVANNKQAADSIVDDFDLTNTPANESEVLTDDEVISPQQNMFGDEPQQQQQQSTPKHTELVGTKSGKGYANESIARAQLSKQFPNEELNLVQREDGWYAERELKAHKMVHKGSGLYGKEDGTGLKAGDVFAISGTGIVTTPFPKSKTNAALNQWLIDNAINKANHINDGFNLTQFGGLNAKNFSQSDGDTLNMYLFDDQVTYRRSANMQGQPLTTQEAQDIVDRVTQGWSSSAPKVHFHADASQFPNLPPDTKAFYDAATGEAHIIADRNVSEADLVQSLLHEVVGHHGTRSVFGNRLDDVMGLVMTLRPNDVQRKATQYGYDLNDIGQARLAAEEVLAEMAETNPKEPTVVQKFFNRVRNLIRAMGFNMKLSDNEINELILQPARQYIQTGHARHIIDEYFKQRPTLRKVGDVAKFTIEKINGAMPIPDNWTPAQKAAARNVSTAFGGAATGISMANNVLERFTQLAFDQFSPIKRFSKEAWMTAHLSRGSDGGLKAMLIHGLPKLVDGAISVEGALQNGTINEQWQGGDGFLKQLGDVLGNEQSMNEWFFWRAAHRAEDLMTQGLESNFTQADINAFKAFNNSPERDAQFKKANAIFDKFNNAVLDIGEQQGLFTAAQRAQWQKDMYLPFYRVSENDNPMTIFSKGNHGLVRQDVIKRLKGGEEKLGDLMGNVVTNWQTIMQSAMRNAAANTAIDALGSFAVPTTAHDRSPNVTWTMRNGVKEYYAIHDRNAFDALESLSFNGFSGRTAKIVGGFKRVLTKGVTIDPSFRVRNTIRDTLQAVATSDVGYNPVANLVNGSRLMQKNHPVGALLLAGGGAITYNTAESSVHLRRMMRYNFNPNQILNTREKMYRALFKANDSWAEFGDVTESVNRAVLYKRAIESGKSHLEASFEARDLLNFTSSGSAQIVRALNQAVPFYNATMQGLFKLGRASKEDPVRVSSVVGTIALASVALMMVNADDDDYWELPDYVRNSNWAVKLGDNWVFIPKPFEVGAMASVVERSVEAMFMNDDYTSEELKKSIQAIVLGQLNMDIRPQIIKPAMDSFFNYDTFRQTPIDSVTDMNRSPSQRFRNTTSQGAVALGSALDVSPQQIEFLARGYFGWLGTQALAVSDLILRPMSDRASNLNALDYSDPTTYPVIKDFLKDGDKLPSKVLNDFYESQSKITQYYNDANDARKRGDTAQFEKNLAEMYDVGNKRLYDNRAAVLSKINQRIKLVSDDKQLSVALRNQMVTQLKKQREDMVRGIK